IAYAHTDAATQTTVDAEFRQVRDRENEGGRLDADYRYQNTPGTGGEFDFKITKNIDTEPSRSAREDLRIKSRWAATGAGRSDIKLSGGDLDEGATVSECWDTNFRSTFFTFSFDLGLGYGTEAAGCAGFTTAVYSTL